ncbi:hypothetical protein GE09DRAFT_1213389 [Coniochaeta sp. 2T2.1]|nr:hypothetical protein GE09DRAFT_1213389 [Coniochaeta sp. 2T2.1]
MSETTDTTESSRLGAQWCSICAKATRQSDIYVCDRKHPRCLACVEGFILSTLKDPNDTTVFPPRYYAGSLPLLPMSEESATLGQLSLLKRLSPAIRAQQPALLPTPQESPKLVPLDFDGAGPQFADPSPPPPQPTTPSTSPPHPPSLPQSGPLVKLESPPLRTKNAGFQLRPLNRSLLVTSPEAGPVYRFTDEPSPPAIESAPELHPRDSLPLSPGRCGHPDDKVKSLFMGTGKGRVKKAECFQCHATFGKFIFLCRGCQATMCAQCRNKLKGKSGKSKKK